eukprot:56496-Amphidinium_carterae.1
MQHIIWECEGRRLTTALSAPENHVLWPAHLRLRGLVSAQQDLDPFDLLALQHYVTTTLIERRADEATLSGNTTTRRPADLDEQLEARIDGVAEPVLSPMLPADHCLHEDAASTGLPGGTRAVSSTDPMPAPLVGSPANLLVVDIASSGDDEHDPGEQRDAGARAPPLKKRRQSWQTVQVPPHITTTNDLIAQKLQCQRCGAQATMQYRVKFVREHRDCEGVDALMCKAASVPSHRLHSRLKRVHEKTHLADDDERQLSAEWHLTHGSLPHNVTQLEEFGHL